MILSAIKEDEMHKKSGAHAYDVSALSGMITFMRRNITHDENNRMPAGCHAGNYGFYSDGTESKVH
jgi:hypothetical protein